MYKIEISEYTIFKVLAREIFELKFLKDHK